MNQDSNAANSPKMNYSMPDGGREDSVDTFLDHRFSQLDDFAAKVGAGSSVPPELETAILRTNDRVPPTNRSCEMPPPKRVRGMLCDTSTVARAPDEKGRSCNLLSVPSVLLGRLWPPEWVVAGLRVCRHLRRELPEHVGNILLVKKAETDVSFQTLASDLLRVSHLTVALKWQGVPDDDRLLPCVASLGTALTQLDVSDMALGALAGRNLAHVLKECTALVSLDLSGNCFDHEQAGVTVPFDLAYGMMKCKSLTHLNFGGICLADDTDFIEFLVGALEEWKALAHLALSNCMIGDDGAGELAKALGECKALVHLDLSNNEIKAQGGKWLAEVLVECKALAHLDLSNNAIGKEGAGRLVEVLGECKALTHLDVRNN